MAKNRVFPWSFGLFSHSVSLSARAYHGRTGPLKAILRARHCRTLVTRLAVSRYAISVTGVNAASRFKPRMARVSRARPAAQPKLVTNTCQSQPYRLKCAGRSDDCRVR
jgi:hypothetical protein